MSIRAEHET
ncbi:hypothetical protein EMWEY_00059150, partial [Eimeria maxima]